MLLNRANWSRPAYWLALSIILIALPLLAACGSGAQTEPPAPVATPEPSTASTTTGDSDAVHTEHSTTNADADPQAGHDSHGSRDNDAHSIPADALTINLPIVARGTTLTRQDLRVSQGDTVRLTATADEPGEIHLHGYDLTVEVSPDHPGELVFEAITAGAFGINFHVFADDALHSESITVESEAPVSVSITAEPDTNGGVDVNIATDGFRFAEELVDQAHTPGAGHAHIYVDGEKLGRVFGPEYYIPNLAPGDHEIRVSLNSNDHSELVYDGAKVQSTVTVTVPDVGQTPVQAEQPGAGDTGSHHGHDHAGHSHDEHEIIAEIHLGNLEVYP